MDREILHRTAKDLRTNWGGTNMKKLLSLCLIIAHLVVTCGTLIAGDAEKSMKVKKVDYLLSADMGTDDGATKGQVFYIIRKINNEEQELGKAKVIYVNDHLCAMKIEEKGDIEIQPGDYLIKEMDIDNSAQVSKNVTSAVFENDPFDDRNYYTEGRIYADDDYNSTGAFIGGMVSGFGLGALGWGLGFLYLSFKEREVPEAYTRDLTIDEYKGLENGYTDKIKSDSRSNFSAGALIGIAGLLVAVANIEK
jgi:hypothetical protein